MIPDGSARIKAEHAAQLPSAFQAWLEDARPRLAVGITIRDSTPDIIEFGFDLANRVLIGSLTSGGDLIVAAVWQEECRDFLLSEEARPQPVADGFVCSLCEREGKHHVFPSLEALWQDHLFEPLEEWINTELANAQAVALYRIGGGDSTWAKLILAGEHAGRPVFLVPLR